MSTDQIDLIVYIARLQPAHFAHVEIVRRSLSMAKHVLIFYGSSYQPRTTENPWFWNERADMMRACLSKEENMRVYHEPLHDIMYNDQAWAEQAQAIVHDRYDMDGMKTIRMIGHSKDETSYYLQMFPQWKTIEIENIRDLNASDIRFHMFQSAGSLETFDQYIGDKVIEPIHDYIRAFMQTDAYYDLVEEFEGNNRYKRSWEPAPYTPTFVTVDAVVVQSGHVLLVRRKLNPGKGQAALPGGFINQNEYLVDGMIRELREETKLKVPEIVLRKGITDTHVFDKPKRSLRGRTITHAYYIELDPGQLPPVKGGDDAKKASWVPLSTFRRMEDQMFEDHFHIINHFVG